MRGKHGKQQGRQKKTRTDQSNFPQCPECDMRIANVFRHLCKAHNYTEAQVGLYKSDSAGHRRKSLPCPDCGKYITHLSRHLRDIHGYPPGTANKATVYIRERKKINSNHAFGIVRM